MTEREVGRSWGLALRRAAAMLPLDARRALAEGVATDLRIVDTVTTGAALMSFRLRAALSKREDRKRG
jgi:hypothetical protein